MALVKETENGAELIINEAPMVKTMELKKALQEELKKLNFTLEDIGGDDFSSAISKMIDFILGAETSERFQKAILDCLQFCTYKNIKITLQMFDDLPEARADYYEIIKDCVEVNLRPFMKSLNSQFPILQIFASLYQSILSQPVGNSK